ncbi:hypothetical protein NC652_024879 [Populus alba x Populus x berolinensis]|nr:hypothetical protein NC652_024879 [Populus alba x Populus x berolinensis]
MEISSTSNLCIHLISCAFQRCRLSQQLCRLSAVLKSPSPSILQISISDTGIGSCLEEFQDLNCSSIISAEFWGKPRQFYFNLMEFSLSKLLVVSYSNDSVSLFRFTFYYGEVYTAV